MVGVVVAVGVVLVLPFEAATWLGQGFLLSLAKATCFTLVPKYVICGEGT